MSKTFIIGTRGSKLALFQSNLVKENLEKNYPKQNFILKKIKTKGDIMTAQCHKLENTYYQEDKLCEQWVK